MEHKETTISILVNNRPDVLARIAGTFSGRGFNIESISANTTKDPALTKIVITTRHNREVIKKIEKQLKNIVDVLKVETLSDQRALHRELLLARINTHGIDGPALEKVIEENGWRLIGRENGFHLVEVTGNQGQIIAALALLEPFNIDDYTRTGVVALSMEHK
ncbi:MAG: acetolactate synthase small subunit [Smithellaceae bacterium]|nr:acetolactate synthase small subunit [Smithellaceae bacterium]